MSKKNDGLIIAAIIGAVIFLPNLLKKGEQGTQGALNYFGGEGGGGMDLTSLFAGIGDMFAGLGENIQTPTTDLSGLLGGNNNPFSGLFGSQGEINQGGNLIDSLNNLIGNLFGGFPNQNGNIFGDLTQPSTPVTTTPTQAIGEYPPDMSNTVPNILNALGYSAGKITTSALQIGGAYIGYRIAQPAIPAIGRVLTGTVGRIAAIGRPFGNLAVQGATNLAARIPPAVSTLGRILTTPIGRLPVLGTIGAAAGAFGVGYGIGTVLERYTPLGQWTRNALRPALLPAFRWWYSRNNAQLTEQAQAWSTEPIDNTGLTPTELMAQVRAGNYGLVNGTWQRIR